MISEMFTLLTSRWDFFAELLLEHMAISLVAILIAMVVGGFCGILISEYARAAKPTMAVINFLYTIPSISMLGFLIPFSGVGNATAVIALTIYALLPMVRNTHTGISGVDPAILEAATGMGSTPLQVLLKIKLPLAMPVIFAGIRSMVTMTIALGGIASFIGAGGLGVAIYRGITTNNAAMTLDGSLLIALLALVVDGLLGLVERRLRNHHPLRHKKRWASALALVLIVAVAGTTIYQSQRSDTIHIASKPMTEQYIISEMLDMLIEQNTDLTVELTQGVGGGTSNIMPGMESGDFDLYPEYTGTAWNTVLKETSVYSEDQFPELEAAYEENYDMQWLGMYGFNNTYRIAVNRATADKYNLTTTSDLAEVASDLTFGAEYDYFEREDGYNAVCEAYGMQFAQTMDIDIGLKYQALSEGQIDATVVFTTDGQLSSPDVVVLEDDLGFFPSYLCGNVVRSDVLDAHPELADELNTLTGTITDLDMAKMNHAVETEGREPRDVAEDFLRDHGLLQ